MADFADLRERGFYYVDKTNYIPELEDYNAPVFLRPRRFGKSLLVSTLAHYYDRTKANRFEELFGGTWIGKHPTKEHNQYMVIRYDFSAMVMANDMEGLAKNFDALNCSPVEMWSIIAICLVIFNLPIGGMHPRCLRKLLPISVCTDFPKPIS